MADSEGVVGGPRRFDGELVEALHVRNKQAYNTYVADCEKIDAGMFKLISGEWKSLEDELRRRPSTCISPLLKDHEVSCSRPRNVSLFDVLLRGWLMPEGQ